MMNFDSNTLTEVTVSKKKEKQVWVPISEVEPGTYVIIKEFGDFAYVFSIDKWDTTQPPWDEDYVDACGQEPNPSNKDKVCGSDPELSDIAQKVAAYSEEQKCECTEKDDECDKCAECAGDPDEDLFPMHEDAFPMHEERDDVAFDRCDNRKYAQTTADVIMMVQDGRVLSFPLHTLVRKVKRIKIEYEV